LTIDASRKSRKATADKKARTSLPRRVARKDDVASGGAAMSGIPPM
jgi:hypothetical protein